MLACATAALSATPNNPFNNDWYVQQSFVEEVQISINDYPNDAAKMKEVQKQPVFYWIDSMARIPNMTAVLDGALAQQKSTGRPTASFFIVYDLPDRDCAAAASDGEITCQDNDCAQG